MIYLSLSVFVDSPRSSKSDPPTLDPPDTVDLVDAPFTVAPLQTDLVVATDTTGPDFKAKKAKTETRLGCLPCFLEELDSLKVAIQNVM